MAANNGEVNVKIKVHAETNGAVKVKQNLNEVGNAAKNAADKSKSSFDKIKGSLGNVEKSAGALRKVFTGLGVAGLFTGLLASIGKIASSFGGAKKEAEEFRKIQDELASSKAIQNLSAQYDKLKTSIAEAAQQQQHELDILDIAKDQSFRKAEAELEREKQSQLAALDPNAADYQERKAAIEADFSSRAASLKADKSRADLVHERQRMNFAADNLDKEAEAEDANAKIIRRRLSDARTAQSNAQRQSVELNENDKTGSLSAVGKTLGQLFTGDWGRMSEAKTAEGDQVRRDAAKRAADLELRVQELEAQLEASKSRAASLRNNATRTREKAEAMGGEFDILALEKANLSSAGQASEADAGRALEKKQAEIAKGEAMDADAASAAKLLKSQEADLKKQIEAEKSRKAAAGQNVFAAQGAFDLAKANGQTGAAEFQALQNAQTAANEVNYSADSAINALVKTLQDVTSRLKAAENHLQKQSSQTHYAWSESPAGE